MDPFLDTLKIEPRGSHHLSLGAPRPRRSPKIKEFGSFFGSLFWVFFWFCSGKPKPMNLTTVTHFWQFYGSKKLNFRYVNSDIFWIPFWIPLWRVFWTPWVAKRLDLPRTWSILDNFGSPLGTQIGPWSDQDQPRASKKAGPPSEWRRHRAVLETSCAPTAPVKTYWSHRGPYFVVLGPFCGCVLDPFGHFVGFVGILGDLMFCDVMGNRR